MFRNLCVQALGVSGRESEIIELALSNGFKGVDLDLLDFAEQVKTQGQARAARLLTSAKLKIGSFPLPVHWLDDAEYKTDLERLPQLIELAAELGCTRATAMIQPADDARPYHENFEFHRRRLAEIAAVLDTKKIRLGLGYLAPLSCKGDRHFQFIRTFDELVLLLRTIGSPNLGVAFDSWHWHVGGGTLDALRALGGEKVVTVSLVDAETEAAVDAPLTARRLPGDGVIDLSAVLTVLAETRYDGPVTPEADRSQFGNLGRDQIVKQAGAALDRVWKAAGLGPTGKLAPAAKAAPGGKLATAPGRS